MPRFEVFGLPIRNLEQAYTGTPTGGTQVAPANCRGLLVETGGLIDIVDIDGNLHSDVPVPAGVFPMFIQELRDTGTASASNIWFVV